jgi:hypothetical protein
MNRLREIRHAIKSSIYREAVPTEHGFDFSDIYL